MLRQKIWGRREISLKIKIKIFNAFVLPVLLYDATVWTLTVAEERRLDAFEMCIMKSIAGIR